MNHVRIDTKLITAAPRRAAATSSAFTLTTMQRIRMQYITDTIPKKRGNLFRLHKLAFGTAAVFAVGAASFTGYAYADGTTPGNLISRIISGNHVRATYQGHAYEYGKTKTYSNAAITAYAELDTVRSLAFRATNSFGAAKDGVEYINDVHGSNDYNYPILATITDVRQNTASLTQQYLLGDKMNPSHDLNTPLSISAGDIQYYSRGNPTHLPASANSQLVAVFSQKYLKHTIATNSVEHVTVYFTFALNHPLSAFKEAEQSNDTSVSDSNMPLYEPSWGGQSNLCNNNPADTCANDTIGHDKGQGLYDVGAAGSHKSNLYNPDSISEKDRTLVEQQLQGAVTSMDENGFTIMTSSKQIWHVAYSASQQASFAAAYSPLKPGDTIAIMAQQPISNLNNRTLDTAHITAMMRL